MKIFNTCGVEIEIESDDPKLPLRVMVCKSVSGVVDATTLNPDLPGMFGRFAYYLKTLSTVTLYQKVFDNWAIRCLATSAGAPIQVGTTPAYQLNSATAADLLLEFKPTVEGAGAAGLYGHIGLFLFTAWYFLIYSEVGNRFCAPVVDFITDKWMAWPGMMTKWGRVTINPKYLVNAGVPTLPYKMALHVRDLSLTDMAYYDVLGSEHLFVVPTSLSAKKKAEAIAQADYEFVQYYRHQFTNFLRAEFKELLEKIGKGYSKDLGVFELVAVGNGSETTGFFNQTNLGLTFFDYDYLKLAKGFNFPYIRASNTRHKDIWCPNESNAPVIFIAQWGLQVGGKSNIAVTYGGKPDANLIMGKFDDSIMKDQDNKLFRYDNASGNLIFKDCPSEEVGLNFTSPGLHEQDEVAFFLCSYVPLPAPPPPPPPSPARLRIDYLFADNEFAIPTSVALAFWTPAWPDVTPSEAILEQAALNTLILKMRDAPGFMIESQISGMGVGERVDMFGSDEFQSDLVPAEDQADNQIPNTEAVKNQYLRYAYGDVTWKTGQGAEPSILNLCAEGFTSPLRCTWESWPAFLAYIAGSTLVTKAAALQIDIGQYVRKSSNLPAPYKTKPSFNTALSAFRAFGMMEAMVKRLKDCADDLTPSQLTNTQRDDIKATLDGFLHLQASTILLQVGGDRMTNVTIDYALFLKYAY